jgi:hypothetical protein
MPIKTIDLDALTNQVGNLYEAVVILSKRARQVAVNTKAELDDKLSYFEGFENELDDARMSEEQFRISLDYELRPKPEETAITEMFDHEIYYRRPDEGEGPEEAEEA